MTKQEWINSLLAKREGSYSAQEQDEYRRELKSRYAGVSEKEFAAAMKKRGL